MSPEQLSKTEAPAPDEQAWQRHARTSRAFEFVVAVALLALALLFSLIDVHDRAIPRIKVQLNATTTYWALDPTINHEKLAEQVPMSVLVAGGVAIPIAVNLAMNYMLPRCRPVSAVHGDTRDFLLSLLQSVALSQILTQFIKNQTGRFRPSFYDMCGWQFDTEWDGVSNLCTDAAHEKEGRKSFPSGHSSFAWSTMLLLTLYLLGRSRLGALNRSESMLRGAKKTLKLFLCFAPTLLATWVALTRSIDNWHHYSDILAGSIIGAVSACVAYGFNYGSVFSWESAGMTREALSVQHKKRLLDREKNAATLTTARENGRTRELAGDKDHATSGSWVVEVAETQQPMAPGSTLL